MLSKTELQRLRSLREKKHREALGLFVVEGEKVIRELLAANFALNEIYTTAEQGEPSAHFASAAKGATRVPVREISAAEMARISHFPTPSTILALGPIVRRPLVRGALARGFTLALDGVQDAGNVGTLLRVADWYGFDRVLLSPDCADLFHQKVINASMGSFARIPTHTVDLAAAFDEAGGTPILGCDLSGGDVHELPPPTNAIVVIGSEGRGLSERVRAFVTHFVTIPKFGAAESLNAAVAAAVVCDNLRRRQK